MSLPRSRCLGSRAAAAPAPHRAPLVVCADPNNLPFSNQARQGFENKIIELVAKDLGRPVSYVWWAQRRGYVRNTLNDSTMRCVAGMASRCRLRGHDPAVLSLDLRLCQPCGRRPRAFDARRPAVEDVSKSACR